MSSCDVPVSDTSQVAQARRRAVACARELGFSETDTGRVALVATEAATNLLEHAGGGTIVVRGISGPTPLVELLAIDRGPGMADVDACLVDGFSTAGSQGTGLGALWRLSTEFDCYSRPGTGTVLLSRVAPERAAAPVPSGLRAGGLSMPYPGETVCGDAWTAVFDRLTGTILVSDGLGHGQFAAEAAEAAVAIATAYSASTPAEIVTHIHDALRHTRGAAGAVARIEPENGRLRYCGVGNISGCIVSSHDVRHLVSHNGTLGHAAHRIQEFTYEWPADALLVLHSDGIATRWQLHDYPGLSTRHPSVVAGVLYRDFRRQRDDATAVVVSGARAG